MPTPSQGTIGSLDYPVEERKKLAKKSLGFVSPVCGPVVDLLKAKKENVTSTAEEAKEIIKTMSIKVSLFILMWCDLFIQSIPKFESLVNFRYNGNKIR